MSIATQRIAGPAVAEPASLRPARFGRRERLTLPLWLALIVGTLYFVIPLLATIHFSLDQGRGLTLLPYQQVVTDPEFYRTIEFSLLLALLTVVASVILIFPTAYWAHLRVPWFRPVMRFMTLLPFVIPPVILALGFAQSWSGNGPVPVALVGTPQLLIAAYVVLSFPYMYGAIDNGLRALDIHTLTEAAQSLGANLQTTLWRVILPNMWPAVVSGALLSFSIVMGEFVFASLFGYNTFPIYLFGEGQARPNKAAAVTILSFAITWLALGLIQMLSRRAPGAAPAVGK